MRTSLLALVAILALAVPMWRATDKITMAAAVVLEREDLTMQVQETTWTSAGPLTHTTKTPRKEGESEDAWVQRHISAVNAMKAAFPPI